MALSKLKFNSINVTPVADQGITFNSSANGLETSGSGKFKFISTSLPNTTFTVTVADSGGNKFHIDGVAADTVSLYRGGTYTFDQSDSSNSGHPLRLSSTSDGTHNSGSEYTTGVTTTGTPGTAGAKTVITVAEDAPTLYYYCTNHSGMGGTANIDAVDDIQFTSGIDSTYDTYLFLFNNIHLDTDDRGLLFNMSTDGGSNYNVSKTSVIFKAVQPESGSGSLSITAGGDLGLSTSDQRLDNDFGADNDQCMSGLLYMFKPSDTTFAKYFMSVTNSSRHVNESNQNFMGCYANTASAINAIKFVPNSSAKIQSGEIILYGIS